MPLRRSALDPLPRLRPPRPSTVVRTGVVAVLLCLAATILYAESPPVALPITPSASPGAALPSGLVGVPVRLAEPGALGAVRPGDRVDLLLLPVAAAVASNALVLLVSTGDLETPVLLIALDEAAARAVLAAGPEARFGVIVRARSPT